MKDIMNRPGSLAAMIVAMVFVVAGWTYAYGGGAGWLAIATAPKKDIVRATSPEAKAAEALFWDTLHGGEYDAVPATIDALTKVYAANPNDPDISRRLGFLHAWHILERNRMEAIPPDISDSAVLSQHYYEQSLKTDPEDYRVMGAVSVLRMLTGLINNDEKLKREGYFLGHTANDKFPEFNYFTTAAALALLPHDDPLFQEGVASQWKLMGVCDTFNDIEINQTIEDYVATHPNHKRVCWNSWIAPHNIEGTLLHMGDFLVKSGDWKTAVEVYQRIKKMRYYETWPLKAFLEARIRDAEANVENFRIDYTDRLQHRLDRPAMLAHSGYLCVSCHQQSGTVPALPGSGIQ